MRFHIEGIGDGFVGRPVWVVESCVEFVGVVEFAANVHGEFELP